MPVMLTRRLLIGALALIGALVSGCSPSTSSTSNPLPDGQALLRDAADSMRTVNSAHFTLKVNGGVANLPVTGADGDLTREGSAKGTADMTEFGQRLRLEFVVANKTLYIKGPTGGFQALPGGTGIYDPSAILDPDRGVARVLSSVSGAKTEAKETIDGVATDRVTGRVGRDAVAGVVPGISSDVDVTFWLREDGKHQPVRASIKLPSANQGAPAPTVDMTLSDVDKPVTVTPPA
jgi:lipoprotein LprG